MTVPQREVHEQLAVGRGPGGQGITRGMAHPPQTLTEEALQGRPPHSQPSVVSSFTGRSKTPRRTLTWPKWGCSSHSPLPSRLLLGTPGPQALGNAPG